MIRLSVIIPAFNAGPLLVEAVRSVEAVRQDVEILVVDDGSTDGSSEVVRGLSGVRLLKQGNRGPGAARNLGLAQARGELVGFLDADDIWLAGRIDNLLDGELPVAVLFYSDYRIRDLQSGAVWEKRSRELDQPAAASLLYHNPICTSTVVAKRTALVAAGGFREDLRFGEDWDLWLRVAEAGAVARLPGVWVEHRQRPGSLAGADRGELHRAQELVLAAALERNPTLYRSVARSARAYLYGRSGLRSYRAGDHRTARRHLWRSVCGGQLRPSLSYLARSMAAGIIGRGDPEPMGDPESTGESEPKREHRPGPMSALSRRLTANLAGSWGAMALRFPIALLLTPFLLGRLGDERFGAFGVLLSLLAYLNLAGGPLHSSVSREIAHAGPDPERRSRVLSSSMIAAVLMALLTVLIGLPLAGPLVDSLRIPAAFRGDAIAAYHALLGTVIASLLATPFLGLLMSRNRYDLVDLIPALGQVVYAGLAVVVFVREGPSLKMLAFAYLASHVLALMGLGLLSWRELNGARFRWGMPDRREFGSLLGFSTQLLVINLSVLLTYQADNLVISRLIGVGAVAHYTVAATLILRVRQLCYGLSRTFMPATADPSTTPAELRDLHFRGTCYMTLLIGGLGAVSVALARPFFGLWLGESYRQSGDLFVILMAANMVAMSQYVTNAVLTGLRHARPLMVSEVVAAVANLALSVGLVKAGFGLSGVAIGTLVPMVVRNAWLMAHGASAVGAAIGPYIRRIYGPVLVLVGITVITLRTLVDMGWIRSWITLGAAGSFGLILYGFFAERWVLDAADRTRFRSLKSRLGMRLGV